MIVIIKDFVIIVANHQNAAGYTNNLEKYIRYNYVAKILNFL